MQGLAPTIWSGHGYSQTRTQLHGWIRLGGVALKTIHAHCRRGMAALTKLPISIDRNEVSIRILFRMAGNALDQAVFLGADTSMNSLITLMQKQLHVIPAHKLRRFHTLVEFSGSTVAVDLSFNFTRRREKAHYQCENERRNCHYSPIPMSMYPLGHTSAQM